VVNGGSEWGRQNKTKALLRLGSGGLFSGGGGALCGAFGEPGPRSVEDLKKSHATFYLGESDDRRCRKITRTKSFKKRAENRLRETRKERDPEGEGKMDCLFRAGPGPVQKTAASKERSGGKKTLRSATNVGEVLKKKTT